MLGFLNKFLRLGVIVCLLAPLAAGSFDTSLAKASGARLLGAAKEQALVLPLLSTPLHRFLQNHLPTLGQLLKSRTSRSVVIPSKGQGPWLYTPVLIKNWGLVKRHLERNVILPALKEMRTSNAPGFFTTNALLNRQLPQLEFGHWVKGPRIVLAPDAPIYGLLLMGVFILLDMNERQEPPNTEVFFRLKRVLKIHNERHTTVPLMTIEDFLSMTLSISVIDTDPLIGMVRSLVYLPPSDRDQAVTYHLAVQAMHAIGEAQGNQSEHFDVQVVESLLDYVLERLEADSLDPSMADKMRVAVVLSLVYHSRFKEIQAVLRKHPSLDVHQWFNDALRADDYAPVPVLGLKQTTGSEMYELGRLSKPFSQVLLAPWKTDNQEILQKIKEQDKVIRFARNREPGQPRVFSDDRAGQPFTETDISKWILQSYTTNFLGEWRLFDDASALGIGNRQRKAYLKRAA